MRKKLGEDKKEDIKNRLETIEEKNNVFEAGKTAYTCTKCGTNAMYYEKPEKCHFCGDPIKVLDQKQERTQALIKQIQDILVISEKTAEEILQNLKEDVKGEFHVIIGLHGGCLEDVKIFFEDEKATECEKKLCQDYGVPLDKEEREQYYDSNGEHEVHHWVVIPE